MKTFNRIKGRWLIPLLMALTLFRPFSGFAQEDTNNFWWLELLPPGCCLGSWSFEDTNWDSDFGFASLSYTNIVQVPDWDGNALQLDATNAAWLNYSITEYAPGYGEYTNLTLDTGSIEFWFVANWESADTNFYGNGPGDWGRFIDVGEWTTNAGSDWWSLYLNPYGTGIYFSSGTNGVRTNYLNTPISWDWNTWHMIVLTYSPTNTLFYLDGQLAASGKGICYVPSGDILTNGFAIGSDLATGMQQAHGQFDDLLTYNYQLNAGDVSDDYENTYPDLPTTFTSGGGFHPADDGPIPPGGTNGGDGGYGADYGPIEPDYGTNLWIKPFGIISNYFTGILSNTVADTEYQLLYVNSLNPPVQWAPVPNGVVVGSEATNWTPWSILFNPTTNFFLNALSYQDDLGSGIPDWWLLKYFGQDTNVDAFADPIGDGYTLYQDYVNGWSPLSWEQPPAPQGLTVDSFNSANNTATLSWLPSPGAVTGYTLETYTRGNIDLPADATNFVDNESSFYDGYALQANYGSGSSAWSDLVYVDGGPAPNGAIVQGPQGNLYLVLSELPPDITEILVNRNSWDSGGALQTVFPKSYAYMNLNFPNDPLSNGSFEIPASNITNGICELPASEITPFFPYQFQTFVIHSNGVAGFIELSGNSDAYHSQALAEVPFIDLRRHMKDNLQFLLRAADDVGSFTFQPFLATWPTNHVCADFYDDNYFEYASGTFRSYPNPLEPLEDNLFYINFVFDASNMTNVDGVPFVNTGYYYTGDGSFLECLAFSYNPDDGYAPPTLKYFLNLPEFVTNPIVPASVLSASETTYLVPPTYEGVYNFYDNFPSSGDQNIYGLPFVAAEGAWYTNDTTLITQTYYPGEGNLNGWPYPDAEQPVLQITNYYFCEPSIDEMPEATDFASTNETPLIIVPVGGEPAFFQGNAPIQLAGFARMSVGYANPGVYGYLGQYFTNAYQIDDNGNVTTNSPGILSPYGQFFATEPGPAAIITMPDIDTGQQGTDIVYCVSLNVDKNHDGVVDTSYTGADTTSQGSPMEFWVNDGCDAPNTSPSGGLDRDLEVPPATTNYTLGQITCPRDLENFARLWICGMPSLPTNGNYQVTLSWNVVSGNPAINLYNSIETNGSTGYLTDTNIAADQCISTAHTSEPYGGLYFTGPSTAIAGVTPSSSYTFPATNFINGGNQYFLFEGAGVGEGELMMSVYRNGNLVAQPGVWLDLHDIKDYYERVVITNNMSGAISNWTSSIEIVQQATSSVLGSDTNLFVMVHGINVGKWEWLDASETVLKRLYWADYNGKFMTVDWPCNFFDIWALLERDSTVFNDSEVKAYKASTALTTYLNQLRSRFPGYQLNLYAHSQGNAIVSEAIRHGAPFDTYILTQGALPDSSYDINAPVDMSLDYADETYGPTPTFEPMGYAGIYTNFTGRIFNFYNTNDPVLAIWEDDQELAKPNTTLTDYIFDGTNGWYIGGTPGGYLVTDQEESRAEISRSLTLSIGQSPPESTHGVIQSGIDLKAQFGFNKAFPDDHSAQWSWPIQTTLPYYQEILTKIEASP